MADMEHDTHSKPAIHCHVATAVHKGIGAHGQFHCAHAAPTVACGANRSGAMKSRLLLCSDKRWGGGPLTTFSDPPGPTPSRELHRVHTSEGSMDGLIPSESDIASSVPDIRGMPAR